MSRILIAGLMLSASSTAFAQEEMTQLGAHVHGVADLAMAMDPGTGELVMEMTGPAYNIYGFERAPQNEEEANRVDAAHAGLLRGDQFVFSDAAGCVWIDTEVTGGPIINGHDHGHDHGDHGHDEHGHDEHSHDDHDHEGHDHHGHGDHDHAHDEGHGHSDMMVRWRFDCEGAAEFNSVDATVLFDVLPSLTTLNVQFFDGTRADADGLTRDRRSFVID